MASPSFLRSSTRPDLYVCARCAFRASQGPTRTTLRWASTKYNAKVANAEHEWALQAQKILNGEKKSMLSILEERGLVKQIAGTRDHLDKALTFKRLGIYAGIDPTAPSLHVGHIVPLMVLFWMYLHGYHSVSLLGGATAKIGDPTDRLKTREQQHSSVKTANMTRMHFQLKKLWQNAEEAGKRYGYKREWAWHRELVNNNAWWNKLPMLHVLQQLGPGMRLGPMLARDTVKNKLTKGDGMSFSEFTYPLMQAWDWWHMHLTKGISIQVGGSDQFGNITAGIDAVKYLTTHHSDPDSRQLARTIEPHGFTTPLLTTSSGAKFGKSAGNAIWLDGDETSTFDLYGYFVRISDDLVGQYLKMLTFMPIPDIDALIEEHMKEPHLRKAQHKLAYEFLALVHGQREADIIREQHRNLFTKGTINLAYRPKDPDMKAGIITLNNNKMDVTLPESLIHQKSMGRILLAAGLTTSFGEGHKLTLAGGVYIGSSPHSKHEPMSDAAVSWGQVKIWSAEETRKFLVHGNLLLLRKGKSNVKIIKVVPDEEYVLSGKSYEGMGLRWWRETAKKIQVSESLLQKDREALEELIKDNEKQLNESILQQADKKRREEAKKQAKATRNIRSPDAPLVRVVASKPTHQDQ